jgi:hypothetical protein
MSQLQRFGAPDDGAGGRITPRAQQRPTRMGAKRTGVPRSCEIAPPPKDHHRALGIFLLKGPRLALFQSKSLINNTNTCFAAGGRAAVGVGRGTDLRSEGFVTCCHSRAYSFWVRCGWSWQRRTKTKPLDTCGCWWTLHPQSTIE